MHYQLSTLPNGIRVITESMPEVRSIAIGCWIDTGSRDETPEEAGCSHFLEHLLFKGSERYSAQYISEAFDAVGAQSNAFTSKEFTCFWARMRDADLPMGLDLMAEMIQRPAFRQEEIDSERQVVLEEINMNDDDPTDVAYERFAQALWKGHLLEYPVLGTRQSIGDITRDTINGYWSRRYSPHSMVVAVGGHLDHEDIVAQITEQFGSWEGDPIKHEFGEAPVEPRVRVEKRDTEQAHLVYGGPGLVRADERRFAFGVLSHVMGSGMSSRLFREIREKRGLAYAVYMFRWPYADSGAWGVYAGTTPSQTPEVLDLIRAELAGVVAEGITADELERAKGHTKGALALAMEDANSRMTRLGRNELSGVEHLSVDEIVGRVEAVTVDDVQALADELFGGPFVLGATGPFEPEELTEFIA
ncbi:MAG: insulinase family protein [Acidimicrobiia bacterium]|nr:insulinase family protein [Acidimicrobiia bacterium]